MIACPDNLFSSFFMTGVVAGSLPLVVLFYQLFFVLFFSVCGRRVKKYNRGVNFPCIQSPAAKISLRTFPRRGIHSGGPDFYKYITIGGIQ